MNSRSAGTGGQHPSGAASWGPGEALGLGRTWALQTAVRPLREMVLKLRASVQSDLLCGSQTPRREDF